MCPACGAPATRPLFSSDGYAYGECTACGSARLLPLPAIEPAELYDDRYFAGGTVAGGYADYGTDEALHRHNAVDRLGRIAGAGGSPPGPSLEIGAGFGYFLAEARRVGWEVAGTDVSAHARRRAAEIGIDLAADPASFSGPFGVLAAFQVIEHIVDPFPILAGGVSLLRPGGLVIVETWDRSHWMARRLGRHWQQVSPPAVVHLFSGDGLRRMMSRLGLVSVTVRATPKYVSLGAVAGHMATSYPRWRGPLERMRASRVGRRPIKYGFGDLVTVTARRPD